jgi:hypothetical protein
MAKHVSTQNMIEKLSGMIGTNDLTGWEDKFVRDMYRKFEKKAISQLTDSQIEVIENLYNKHFA